MSYRWFKDWADKTPKTIILIETREGFESFGTCAMAVFRLIGAPMFRPNKKEKTKEPEVLVQMRDYPTLLDKMNRYQISYLVAREDFKVYSKEFDQRSFDIFTAPIKNPEKANDEDRMDRGLAVDDRVTVKNLETRKECCWKLVPAAEADVNRREKSGNLSIESVVGNALLGHRVGEDLTIVRGLNDSATYRILFALDADDRKLKKVKREKMSKAAAAEEAAEEDEARKHLADIAAFAEMEEANGLDFLNPEPGMDEPTAPVVHLKTQNAHVSSALMNDDGPVMVFKEKTPEELAAEQAERDRIAAEQAALAAEQPAEFEAPVFADGQPVEFEAPMFADEQPVEFAAPVFADGQPAEFEAPMFADEQPAEFEAPMFADEQPAEFEAPAFADEQPVEFEAPMFADEQPVEFEAPVFADEQPVEFEAPMFADEQPAEFEAPAFADEQPVEFIDPVAVSNQMPVNIPDVNAAFADEIPVSAADADAFLQSMADGTAPAAPIAPMATDIPASTAIVPFATSLSEMFFGPKKAGKAKHAAAKRIKSKLPKSAKHIKTRAMRKLEKLASRSHAKGSAT